MVAAMEAFMFLKNGLASNGVYRSPSAALRKPLERLAEA
jgi:hypothetical protein